MYTDGYRAIFESLGIQVGKADGISSADLQSAEKEFGIQLPSSLSDYYLLCGNEKKINRCFNRLLTPDKWFIEADRLVFMEENQCVVFWGTPSIDHLSNDAAVFQGVNVRDHPIDWQHEHDSCFTFLKVMAVWHATFGGALEYCASAQVEEERTRRVLDLEWSLVGEVNGMRAYTQQHRAVCFLKWEDSSSDWRVFAGSKSGQELGMTKESLPAEWEQWG